jgi:hypothetical protein
VILPGGREVELLAGFGRSARKLSGARPSQRSMNNACWHDVRGLRVTLVSVDGLIG